MEEPKLFNEDCKWVFRCNVMWSTFVWWTDSPGIQSWVQHHIHQDQNNDPHVVGRSKKKLRLHLSINFADLGSQASE